MTKAKALKNYLNAAFELQIDGMSQVEVLHNFLKQCFNFDSKGTSPIEILQEMIDNELFIGEGSGGTVFRLSLPTNSELFTTGVYHDTTHNVYIPYVKAAKPEGMTANSGDYWGVRIKYTSGPDDMFGGAVRTLTGIDGSTCLCGINSTGSEQFEIHNDGLYFYLIEYANASQETATATVGYMMQTATSADFMIIPSPGWEGGQQLVDVDTDGDGNYSQAK